MIFFQGLISQPESNSYQAREMVSKAAALMGNSNNGFFSVNAAAQYLYRGTNTDSKHSFAGLIPAQNIQFIELGYQFKRVKQQPQVQFEYQNINALPGQSGAVDLATFDQLIPSMRTAAGVYYFFNGMGTNLRLSYNAEAFNVQQEAL